MDDLDSSIIKVPFINRKDSEFVTTHHSMAPLHSTLAKNSTSYILAINDAQTVQDKDQMNYRKHEQELRSVIATSKK